MGDFNKLVVWNKAMGLATVVYCVIKKLPAEERYALADQMRRAAISIPSNISEGHTRYSDRDFSHFGIIDKGSGAELQTQLLLCGRLGYLKEEEVKSIYGQIEEVQRMLSALIARLKETKTTSYHRGNEI